MESITKILENELRNFITGMSWFERDCNSLEQLYFDAGVNTELSALSSTDKATEASKLSQAEVINGITFIQNLKKFFTSGSPANADYLSTCHNLSFGSTTTPAYTPSTALEDIGNRLKGLSDACIELDKNAQTILDIYFDNQINTAFTAVSTYRKVFGSEMTIQQMNNAMTLVENFQKFLNGNSPSNADYASTIAQWRNL